MKSNFAFMENINMDLYKKLEEAEKSLYISSNKTGITLRGFWEQFTAYIISENNIEEDLKDCLGERRADLGSRLAFLTQPGVNEDTSNKFYSSHKAMANLNKARQRKGQPPIKLFPNLKIPATYTAKGSGQPRSRYYDKTRPTKYDILLMDFFRQYANDCVHELDALEKPVYEVTFTQTLDYMQRLHKFLQVYFGVQVGKYDERIIRFDKFEVTKVDSSPNDGFLSNCCKECEALYYPTKGYAKSLPAIIRFFEKSDIEEVFASRAAGVNSLLHKNACGKGLRNVVEVSNFDTDSQFYIVAYVFENETTVLSNDLLNATPFDTRLQWCKEIAGIVNNLHTNDPKICHRMINHNCVYFTKELGDDSQYAPSLIKLSFAKILDSNAPTVFEKATDAVEIIRKRAAGEAKYIADEYSDCSADDAEFHWEKVDIFALGMLIADILCANISAMPHDGAALEAAGVNQNIIEIIGRCWDVAEERPTAAEVLAALQNI